MGAVVFFSLGMSILLSQPIITSLFARRCGRSPLKWFFIGLVLPGIATFILFFLRDLSEEKKDEIKR